VQITLVPDFTQFLLNRHKFSLFNAHDVLPFKGYFPAANSGWLLTLMFNESNTKRCILYGEATRKNSSLSRL